MKRAAVVSKGWLGDSIACTAAATSLYEKGYQVDFFTRWPQLAPILRNDNRYKTVVYGKYLIYKLRRPLLPKLYDVVVSEPDGWSYDEPFTSQIRRLAGCSAYPEYELYLSDVQVRTVAQEHRTISIPRDIHKRAYGRNIPELVKHLSQIAEIVWVGLDPNLSSKHGKNFNLMTEAVKIKKSSLFFGPESGLLWLAAGLNQTCYYLSEHIEVMTPRIGRGNPKLSLGSVNHFPNGPHHAFTPYCSDTEIVDKITEYFSNIQ